MNISLNWLQKYIDLSELSIEELSEILTTIGLEVEGIEQKELVKGGLEGVVVGKVLTCTKHPNADKLSVTTVDVGASEPIQVVCGAPNVAAGLTVLVATVGTTLYNGDEPWKIKKGKIRGEVSAGMICAEDELGLGSSHEGIMELSAELTPGSPAADHFDIGSDTIYEIGLTPNRSDATSHLGVAKDVAAYLQVNKDYAAGVKEPEVSSFDAKQTNMPVQVVVDDTVSCPRYSGVTLTDVTIGDSPEWMQKLLLGIGVRPINNIVDITNYVLHELGQPLHAFDYDKIAEQSIVVTKLASGTPFTALDDTNMELHQDDIMICDGARSPMCIAGVFGGAKSGVTDETKTIFLESAHFDASHIRKSSTRHLLRTDAAKVYEKGSDPNITVYALKRAALLMQEYAGAKVVSEVVDIYPKEIEPAEVYLTYQKINRIIGNDIARDEVHTILRAMDMEILPKGEDGFVVKIPTNKADVTRDVDVIEEILRIYGFNKIVVSTKVNSTLNYSSHPDKKGIKNIVADHLSAIGYNEMMGLSLIESKYYDELLPIDTSELVYINNTSNIHLNIMRPEMLMSGLQSVVHNHNRQQSDLRLYEYGKSYRKQSEGYLETEYLTIYVTGQRSAESWLSNGQQSTDYYDIKGAVHQVLDRLGVSSYQVSESEDSRLNYGLQYHRGSQVIASYGEVSDKLTKGMSIKSKVYYAEINIEKLVAATKSAKVNIEKISKFPSVRRDLALVVDTAVKFADVERLASKADKKLLKSVSLFDVYENEEQLGKNKKSYSVSYHFEDMDKTLKDKDIDKIMQKMIASYTAQLGANIRS